MTPEDRRQGTRCQVSGCRADLSLEGRAYHVQKRLCAKHMQAEAVMCRGQADELFRFCFQCGKLEPLSAFDGARRACRAKLQLRRARKAASNPNLGSGLPSLGLMPADISFKSEQVEEQWPSNGASGAAAAAMAWAPAAAGAAAMPATSHHSLQGVSALANGALHQLSAVSAAAWEQQHQHQQRQQHQYTNSPFSVPLCSSSAAVGMVQGVQRAATCPAAMVAADLYGGAGPSGSFTGVPPAVPQGDGGGGSRGGSDAATVTPVITSGFTTDSFEYMLADMLACELAAAGGEHSQDGSCGPATSPASSEAHQATLAAAAAAASGGDCSTSSGATGLAPGPAQQHVLQQQERMQQIQQQLAVLEGLLPRASSLGSSQAASVLLPPQPQPQQSRRHSFSLHLPRLASAPVLAWEQAQHAAAAPSGGTAAASGGRPPPTPTAAAAGSVPVHAPGAAAVPLSLQPAHAATQVAALQQHIAAAEAQLEAMWAYLHRVSARGPPV